MRRRRLQAGRRRMFRPCSPSTRLPARCSSRRSSRETALDESAAYPGLDRHGDLTPVNVLDGGASAASLPEIDPHPASATRRSTRSISSPTRAMSRRSPRGPRSWRRRSGPMPAASWDGASPSQAWSPSRRPRSPTVWTTSSRPSWRSLRASGRGLPGQVEARAAASCSRSCASVIAPPTAVGFDTERAE